MTSSEEKSGLHIYAVRFEFPELKFVSMYQSATAKATDAGTAINRAYKEVKKRKGVKGYSISQMKISVVRADGGKSE